jgi:hypothetical protein
VKVHGATGMGALCIEEHGEEPARRDGSEAAETDGIAGSIWIVSVLEGRTKCCEWSDLSGFGGHRDGLLSSAGRALGADVRLLVAPTFS